MTLIENNLSSPNLHHLLDDFFTKDLTYKKSKTYAPFNTKLSPVNILENDDRFLIEATVPRMSKKDFNTESNQKVLTISTKKKESSNYKDNKFLIYKYGAINHETFDRFFHNLEK